jgi:DNA-binding response OmpR family regulator
MRNAGRVLGKPQITEHVWGYDSRPPLNVVEIYIHYLRDKIDRASRPLIRTIRGVAADQRMNRLFTRIRWGLVAWSMLILA